MLGFSCLGVSGSFWGLRCDFFDLLSMSKEHEAEKCFLKNIVVPLTQNK